MSDDRAMMVEHPYRVAGAMNHPSIGRCSSDAGLEVMNFLGRSMSGTVMSFRQEAHLDKEGSVIGSIDEEPQSPDDVIAYAQMMPSLEERLAMLENEKAQIERELLRLDSYENGDDCEVASLEAETQWLQSELAATWHHVLLLEMRSADHVRTLQEIKLAADQKDERRNKPQRLQPTPRAASTRLNEGNGTEMHDLVAETSQLHQELNWARDFYAHEKYENDKLAKLLGDDIVPLTLVLAADGEEDVLRYRRSPSISDLDALEVAERSDLVMEKLTTPQSANGALPPKTMFSRAGMAMKVMIKRGSSPSNGISSGTKASDRASGFFSPKIDVSVGRSTSNMGGSYSTSNSTGTSPLASNFRARSRSASSAPEWGSTLSSPSESAAGAEQRSANSSNLSSPCLTSPAHSSRDASPRSTDIRERGSSTANTPPLYRLSRSEKHAGLGGEAINTPRGAESHQDSEKNEDDEAASVASEDTFGTFNTAQSVPAARSSTRLAALPDVGGVQL